MTPPRSSTVRRAGSALASGLAALALTAPVAQAQEDDPTDAVGRFEQAMEALDRAAAASEAVLVLPGISVMAGVIPAASRAARTRLTLLLIPCLLPSLPLPHGADSDGDRPMTQGGDASSFKDRIRRSPDPFDKERGAEIRALFSGPVARGAWRA